MMIQYFRSVLMLTALAACVSVAVPSLTSAQELSGLPSWFDLSGSHRTRYEHLQRRFQPTIPGNDAALSLRTTLLAQLSYSAVTAGVELMDSRVYLADENTQLNTTHVNPVDVLQAYVETGVADLFADGARLRLRLGRQTMDVGSRRFVARNRFRNTINAYTGLDLEWTSPTEEIVRAFVFSPVQRRVNSARDNEPQLDIERTESVFWGAVFASRLWSPSIRGEFQLFGIHERDSDEYQTANRNFVTPALRFFRNPRPSLFDFEVETAVQAGTSRRTALPEDTTRLRHFAFFVHGALGYSFAGSWRPRLVLQYDYASGDKDPSDDANGRFDTLYGARRFDFGPTGIYGAFARSNISSPGVRAEVRPHALVDGFIGYRSVWIAQARDGWTTTAIRDVNGASGTFLGHQIEGSVRWRLLNGKVAIENGFAFLSLGGFPRNAPNGDPGLRNPAYIYTQVTLQI